jgi:hypothetical protein
MTLLENPEIPFYKTLISTRVPDLGDYKYVPHDPKTLHRRSHYNLTTMVQLELKT